MTIASAIDYINDKLAGSDQQPAQTIEQAIMLLADNIGGGSSGGGGLVVHVDMQTFALDKKYSEIVAAAQVGYVGMLMQSGQDEYDVYSLVGYGYDSGDGYCVFFKGSTSSVATFAAEAEDGYPVAAD